MNKLYTDETLLLYYYEECDVCDKIEVEHMLETNIEANIAYSHLYESLMELPKKTYAPKEETLSKILAYSRL
jgi:hypothetical protein